MGIFKIDYNSAYNACLNYFKGDVLATEVFLDKYAMRDDDGNLLESTPDAMHHRMAKEFARIEEKFGGAAALSEDEIYRQFKDFRCIVPAGSVMSGLGNGNYVGSLSNCFFIGSVKDSYSSIMKHREHMVQLEKRRGGVGVDITELRPSGAKVHNAAKTSTGAVSFMEGFSSLSKEVAQNGRRGALMISIECKHPDVEEFMMIKQDITKVTGANISVKFTDDFMNAVMNDSDFCLRWPVSAVVTDEQMDKLPYDEKVWENGICMKRIRAKELWNKFVHCAWNTAEPGIMYFDRQHEYSPDGVYDEYRSVGTNPCGEIPLPKGDSCRLMSINFKSFVRNPYTEYAEIDREALYETARINMRLCDDLVELELEHVQQIIDHIKSTYTDDNLTELKLWENIYEVGKSSRRCGCGGTGLGDTLAELGLKMGSEKGLEAIEEIFKIKEEAEFCESVNMAKERGAFKGFDINKEVVCEKNVLGHDTIASGRNTYFQHILDEVFDYGKDTNRKNGNILFNWYNYGRRNVNMSTMAPTGSVSLLTQSTSGIEPLFSPYYRRRKKVTSPSDRVDITDESGEKFTEYLVIHQPFKEWIMGFCSDYDKSKGFDEQATDEKLDAWFRQSPWYGSTASEITPRQHVDCQAVCQKYTGHSISKTVNLPESATEKDVNDIYIYGWMSGLKGVTVYRDNCRNGILVKKSSKECNCGRLSAHDAPKRPKVLKCDIKRFRNGGERWIACIGLYEGVPYEIFTGLEEKLGLPYYVAEGEIIKNKVDREVVDEDTGEKVMKKVSRYDIRYTDSKGEKVTIEGLSSSFKAMYNNYSKLISGLCRHGMPLEYIVATIKSLTFDNDHINSWKNGVIRAFKPYLKDGEVKGETCPECGGKLVRVNGCISCPSCGWSKCG